MAGQLGFDVAELRRSEIVIKENKRRVGGGDDLDNFVEFALADEAGGIGFLTALGRPFGLTSPNDT